MSSNFYKKDALKFKKQHLEKVEFIVVYKHASLKLSGPMALCKKFKLLVVVERKVMYHSKGGGRRFKIL